MSLAHFTTTAAPVITTRLVRRRADGRILASTAAATLDGHAIKTRVTYEGIGISAAHEAAARAMARRLATPGIRYTGATTANDGSAAVFIPQWND